MTIHQLPREDDSGRDQAIAELFSSLLIDLDDLKFIIENHPLLAHYTSVDVLEKIMKNDEIWFSNPLFMNDLEEVRFGVLEGVRIFQQSEEVNQACKTASRAAQVRQSFDYFYKQFSEQHAFDTYVFCLSLHDIKETDGRLSMWRGYGGQGNGAALVFNTTFITEVNPTSPLLIAKVHYDTAEGRISWLSDRISQWCGILANSSIPDKKLYIAAHQLFMSIKLFALKSKHSGFRDEQEWRLIYMPERDTVKIGFRFDYIMGKRGVEPKLKFQIKPLDPNLTWTFGSILEQIILGPSLSSWLARRGIERMLETLGKPDFKEKLSVSRIPLRPI